MFSQVWILNFTIHLINWNFLGLQGYHLHWGGKRATRNYLAFDISSIEGWELLGVWHFFHRQMDPFLSPWNWLVAALINAVARTHSRLHFGLEALTHQNSVKRPWMETAGADPPPQLSFQPRRYGDATLLNPRDRISWTLNDPGQSHKVEESFSRILPEFLTHKIKNCN